MSVSPEKYSYAKPVTLTDPKPDPMLIDYKFTRAEKDHVILCELEVAAMKRHRVPEGLEVTSATAEEWNEAVAAFRGHK